MRIAKLIIIGRMGVGKTSLRMQYLGHGFTTNYLPTLGADFAVKSVKLDTGEEISLQIWDIAGQDSFIPLQRRFYSKAKGVIIVFDLVDVTSFEDLIPRLNGMWEILPKDTHLLIVGNKLDLEEQRKITPLQVEDLINELVEQNVPSHRVDYIETSAKTGVNVNSAFNNLAVKIAEGL